MFFDIIRGGQVISHNLEMLKQVIIKLLSISFLISFLLFLFLCNKNLSLYNIKNTGNFIIAKHYVNNLNQPNKLLNIDLRAFNKDNKKIINIKAIDIINNNILIANNNKTISNFFNNIFISFFIFCLSNFFIIFIFLIKGYYLNKSNYLRGAKLVSSKYLNSLVKIYNKKNKYKYKLKKTEQLLGLKQKHYDYKIANILYPHSTESVHTIITGASGSGKTVLISDLIKQIRDNGDKAIIYDRMGTFISKFFNGDEIDKKIKDILEDKNIKENRKEELIEYYMLKKDIILNPIDERSPFWSIFNEVRDGLDFDNIASALIPENAGTVDPFWNVAARILFSSVANRLREQGNTSNKDLINKLLKINLKEAATLVKGTPAQSIIDEQNPKTALSVMSMISTNLKSLTHLRERKDNEEPFSIRKWIQNEDEENFLFISSRADRHDTLKPLITTWLDIAINSLLSLEQSNSRKIWIIIDELPSLYYLPSLHTGLAESRQFGGCFVLSLQTMAQLRSIYGKEKAEATSGLCRNRIILNTPDEDTATWCSDNLGKVELKETKENISFGANEWKDGVSLTKQDIQKNIVLPTEIMQLKNLTAYVKFAGDFPIAKSKFKYKNYPKKAERYIEYINTYNYDDINENNKNDNNIIEEDNSIDLINY